MIRKSICAASIIAAAMALAVPAQASTAPPTRPVTYGQAQVSLPKPWTVTTVQAVACGHQVSSAYQLQLGPTNRQPVCTGDGPGPRYRAPHLPQVRISADRGSVPASYTVGTTINGIRVLAPEPLTSQALNQPDGVTIAVPSLGVVINAWRSQSLAVVDSLTRAPTR